MNGPDHEWVAALRSTVLAPLVRLVGFTVGAVLVIGVSVLLLAATLRIVGSATDSTTIQSLLALAVFMGSVAVSTYLLVRHAR